jgi:hypothetical protein
MLSQVSKLEHQKGRIFSLWPQTLVNVSAIESFISSLFLVLNPQVSRGTSVYEQQISNKPRFCSVHVLQQAIPFLRRLL